MKKRTKVLLMVLCSVALIAGSAAGAIAYLTDNEAVTNTFTVGQVGITLDEAPVDANGKATTGDRVLSNTYKLIPGQTYDKDPTIHVDPKSEDCYLFVKVENGIKDIEGGTTIAAQMKELGWAEVEGYENVYVFAKGGSKYVIAKGGHVEVFKNFTIDGAKVVNVPDGESVPDGKIDLTAFEKAEVKVTAYAVQAAGFEKTEPEDIWAATFGASANP